MTHAVAHSESEGVQAYKVWRNVGLGMDTLHASVLAFTFHFLTKFVDSLNDDSVLYRVKSACPRPTSQRQVGKDVHRTRAPSGRAGAGTAQPAEPCAVGRRECAQQL